MATRKAIASGNWSNPAIWDGGVSTPDAGDDVYSNTFTVTIDQHVTARSLRNSSDTGITAGGGYIITNNMSVIADYVSASGNLFTFSSITVSAQFTGNALSANNATAFNILNTCTGTIIIIGNVTAGGNYSRGLSTAQNGGVLEIIGNVTGGTTGGYGGSAIGIEASSSNISINITGTVKGGNSDHAGSGALSLGGTGNSVVITGNVECGLLSTTGGVYGISMGTGNSLRITGNVISRSGSSSGAAAVTATGTYYLKIIGSIIASRFANGVSATSTTGVNIFTGPFISDQYGMLPVLCARMHITSTVDSYYEFRDDSTNGSLLTPAIAYTLYPIGTAGDVPAGSDVRDGVEYAFATKIGTCAVPPAASVAIGVPVDDTVGEAVLSAIDLANVIGNIVGAKIEAAMP